MAVEIIKAGLSHAEEITRIEKESFSAPWSDASIRSAIEDDVVNCVCLLKDGKTAGYAMFAFVCDEGELLNIAIDPAYRGEGLGSAILSHIIQTGKALGCENMFLEVRRSNLPAATLYRKFGFEVIGERKNYYRSPTEDALVMALRMSK